MDGPPPGVPGEAAAAGPRDGDGDGVDPVDLPGGEAEDAEVPFEVVAAGAEAEFLGDDLPVAAGPQPELQGGAVAATVPDGEPLTALPRESPAMGMVPGNSPVAFAATVGSAGFSTLTTESAARGNDFADEAMTGPEVAAAAADRPRGPSNLDGVVDPEAAASVVARWEGIKRPTSGVLSISADEVASIVAKLDGSPTLPTPASAAGAPPPLPPGPPVGGEDGEDGEGEEEGPEEAELRRGREAAGSPPMQALRWFYERLTLTAEDREMLWRKRGLTAETCAWAGLVSSLSTNREILLGMAVKAEAEPEAGTGTRLEAAATLPATPVPPAAPTWPVGVLVDAGLWVRDAKRLGGGAKPNAQLFGFGLMGKKKVAGRQDKEEEWGWTYPVLIPYFDESGEVIALRAHKGGTKEKAARMYVVRGRKGVPPLKAARAMDEPMPLADVAVMSEGEFKGLALWQALCNAGGRRNAEERSVVVACLPGVQMAKPMAGEIEDWLDGAVKPGAEVVVAFDAEEKGDPALPGYQEDPKKRNDAQVWARILAKAVTKEGYRGKVCVLPKEWQDAKGKADWDGALALLIGRWGGAGASLVSGEAADAVAAGIWKRVADRVRREFWRVLEGSLPAPEMWGLFDAPVERDIQNAILNLEYEPKLPVGGYAEEATHKRLMRLYRRLRESSGLGSDKAAGKRLAYLKFLAKQYEGLAGRYYIFKRLSEPKAEEWHGVQLEAGEEDVDLRRACEVVMKGIPQPVTDFFMRCRYELKRTNGKRSRLVELESVNGVKTGMVELPSDAFAQPAKWREWLLNQGGFSWTCGEQALQALHVDTARASARYMVSEVTTRGWHAEAKLWFFKDVAYTADGEAVWPERHTGIFWHQGVGYKLGEKDQEGEAFIQGEPLMRPAGRPDAAGGKSEEEATRELFVDAARKMNETLGEGYDGYLALGMMLACGAAPEVYKHYTAFPGLWVHGAAQQGKSSFVKWLLRIWGYKSDTGLKLDQTTKVGVAIGLQQAGNLPLWLEEIQSNTPEWMVDVIKASYNRETGAKKTFGEGTRQVLRSVIVSGVATARDAQVRSRFAHIQVSASNRKKNHFEWFEARSVEFYCLGRYVLRNRREYQRLVVEALARWMKSEDTAGADARARLVHGVAYAGFFAMVALLQSHGPDELKAYRDFLVRQTLAQVAEVARTMDANVFFEDILSAVEKGAFGNTPGEMGRLFRVMENKSPRWQVPPYQLAATAESSLREWKHLQLYFRPGPVINALKEYKRRMGQEMAISQGDLLSHMQMQPYWVPPKKGRNIHAARFGGPPTSCWCVDLDYHPMGRREVAPEEWEESFFVDGNRERFVASMDWEDPRKGDLFMLVRDLQRRSEGDGGGDGGNGDGGGLV